MSADDTYLTEDEIRRATKRVYGKRQCAVLAEMGVPFLVGGDGHPLVLRSVHDRLLGEKPSKPRKSGLRLDGLARA